MLETGNKGNFDAFDKIGVAFAIYFICALAALAISAYYGTSKIIIYFINMVIAASIGMYIQFKK